MTFEREQIRNFSIIAHIDHGKSTLADRLLELTGSVERRLMRDQFLDQMELERERGITIKMQPVRMIFRPESYTEIRNPKFEVRNKSEISNNQNSKRLEIEQLGNWKLSNSEQEFVLNLIDTPGHVDFAYEVSRALRAVEGAILLVDATQGVEAQTISVLELARELNLVIIPVINKIDLPQARVEAVRRELAELLKASETDVLCISAKTGEGVPALARAIIERIPPPCAGVSGALRALVFDFAYTPHRGVIAYVRVMDGALRPKMPIRFARAEINAAPMEIGFFAPEMRPVSELGAGAVGYVVTGIKEAHIVRVGDTILDLSSSLPALDGYKEPRPMIWASIYPAAPDMIVELRRGLDTLKLSDSAFSFEEESSGALGRGFRCGFLGMLHLEIIVERLRREHRLDVVVTSPTVCYEILALSGKTNVYAPHLFPNDRAVLVSEPWVSGEVLLDQRFLGPVMRILPDYEATIESTEPFPPHRLKLIIAMPMRELMRHFFDKLKSVSSGYASLNYKFSGVREADVVRLDVLVAGERVDAFSRIVGRRRLEEEAGTVVRALAALLPRQLFEVKIQAETDGRIIRSRSVSALRKNVAGHLYGGDRTRKMKLWQKQKKGKKRLQAMGKVRIPESVFLDMVKQR